jgi:hypothetical protein
MKRTLNKLIKGEKGQALILVLVLMVLGGIVLAPLLAYMSTGLKIGKEVYEERMYGQYAADAGVEDALYKIRTDDPALPDEWEVDPWDKDSYDTSYGPPEYPSFQLNGNDVQVTIQPYWFLEGLETPPTGMTPHADMVVVGDTIGSVGGNGLYQISINYDRSKGELKIDRIGVWLPAGFSYVTGTSNLEQAPPGAKYYCVPGVVPYRGGEAIIWDFSSPPPLNFEQLPGDGDKRIVTFQFTPDRSPISAFSWTVARRVDVYLSWDVDIKLFQITSQATDAVSSKSITVEAYVTKNEMRELGSATSGDYCAVGGTLLEATGSGGDEIYRDQLYMQSSATITDADIPSSATVQAAYLYWSGWIDYHYTHWNDKKLRWEWGEILELEYPSKPTPDKLIDLVENEAKVNTVSLLFGTGAPVTITADEWQINENEDQAGTWSYSCFYDATGLVKQLISDDKVDSNGSGTYTVKHAVVASRPSYPTYYFELHDTGQYTGYPLGTPAHQLPTAGYYQGRYEWAYAGWSLIIIYSSAETKGHQLYLYDDFVYSGMGSSGNPINVDFNGDGNPGGTIGGFLAPEDIIDELYAAHLTCFVGEGDEIYDGDYIKLEGTSLSNAASPAENVWNSTSPGLAVDGIDIDTFTVGYPTIEPGDTSAQVDLLTEVDSWNLVYIILSFRSKITTSGAVSYIYVGG